MRGAVGREGGEGESQSGLTTAWSGAWQEGNNLGPEGVSALAGALSSMPNLATLVLVSGGVIVWVREHGWWGSLWMMQAWGAGKGLEEEGGIREEDAAEEGL